MSKVVMFEMVVKNIGLDYMFCLIKFSVFE